MKTRGQRLKLAMQLRGVQTNELDRAIGKGGTGYTSRLANDKKKKRVDLDVVRQMAEVLKVRFQWLEWGTGPMEGEIVSELEAMFGDTSKRPPEQRLDRSKVDIAADYWRANGVRPEAIERVRTRGVSHDLGVDEIGELFLEEQRVILDEDQKKLRELSAKVSARKSASTPKEPTPVTVKKRRAS